jgi:hypothetical protein
LRSVVKLYSSFRDCSNPVWLSEELFQSRITPSIAKCSSIECAAARAAGRSALHSVKCRLREWVIRKSAFTSHSGRSLESMRITIWSSLLISVSPAFPRPAAKQHAKNVILLLQDAGGIATLNGASIYGYNASLKLFVQSWPQIGLSNTSPLRNG